MHKEIRKYISDKSVTSILNLLIYYLYWKSIYNHSHYEMGSKMYKKRMNTIHKNKELIYS